MDFIKFNIGEQKEFLIKVKEKSGLSWPRLAKIVNKSRSTILAYLREECKIPKPVFDVFNSKYGLKIGHVKIVVLNNTKKEINFPKISNDFSEFLGALAGDGHLHFDPAEMSITCHAILDKKYVYYLSGLFKNLFNQTPTIFFQNQNNAIKLRFYSKELVEKLSKSYNFPIGKKKNRLHIPKQVFQQQIYLVSFIRGLFDTDGTITRHHKKSGAIVEIVSRDNNFLKEVNKGLIKLKFKTSLGYKGVKIYSENDIHKFFKLIKPSNPKHNLKYKIFKKRGYIPLNKDLIMRR